MGWEPAETHTHYDTAGNVTGSTVVTREPEWDDFERDRLLALAHYEAGVHSCGWHKDMINDPDVTFTSDTQHCSACRLADISRRIYEANDEPSLAVLKRRHGDPLPPNVGLPSDGRSVIVKIKQPDD